MWYPVMECSYSSVAKDSESVLGLCWELELSQRLSWWLLER
jgi:hypothetical protein